VKKKLLIIAVIALIIAMSVGFFIIRNRNSSELPIYSFELEGSHPNRCGEWKIIISDYYEFKNEFNEAERAGLERYDSSFFDEKSLAAIYVVRPTPIWDIINKCARVVDDNTVVIRYNLRQRRWVGTLDMTVWSAIVVEIPKNVTKIIVENNICFNYDCECNYIYQEYIFDEASRLVNDNI